jgi:hypothetical protein
MHTDDESPPVPVEADREIEMIATLVAGARLALETAVDLLEKQQARTAGQAVLPCHSFLHRRGEISTFSDTLSATTLRAGTRAS